MILTDILQNVILLKTIGETELDIQNIQFDSRKVGAGSVFVATRGTASDGHQFISMSIEKGALAVVCEEIPSDINPSVTYVKVENSSDALGKMASAWYDFPSSKMTLVGVTGTNGKTTIVTLLYQLFRQLGHKSGLLSTVCNYVNDLPVEATHTTPDALELNELLDRMVKAGCEYAFMEVSSHSIDQRRIAGLEFDGGIFTNITRDHIDYHLTFENYLKAKKQFFDDLSGDAFALTNADDKNGLVMLQNSKARKYTYSLRTVADFKTRILEHGFEGMLLDMNDREVNVWSCSSTWTG